MRSFKSIESTATIIHPFLFDKWFASSQHCVSIFHTRVLSATEKGFHSSFSTKSKFRSQFFLLLKNCRIFFIELTTKVSKSSNLFESIVKLFMCIKLFEISCRNRIKRSEGYNPGLAIGVLFMIHYYLISCSQEQCFVDLMGFRKTRLRAFISIQQIYIGFIFK